MLALFGLALSFLFAQSQVGERLEGAYYDKMMRWRHLQAKAPQLDERLLILGIDEKTRQQIKDPIALWVPLYAEVLKAAYDSGAVLVGFDIIPTYAPRERALPFALTLIENPEKLVMVTFYDPETEILVEPAEMIKIPLGENNLALSNVTRDSDGITRRQSFQNFETAGLTRAFFSQLLFERLSPNQPIPQQALINFVGPKETIPHLSFGDVVDWIQTGNKAELRRALEGKILLVGGTAKADQDFLETPFSSTDSMAGIEVHGNILNTLLTKQWLEPRNVWMLLLVFLIPLAWTSLEKSLSVSSTFFICLSALWLGASYLGFLGGSVWTPSIVGVLGLASTYLGGYLYRFNTVEKERRRIRSVFGRYVSPDVMEAMLEVPEDHKPEHAKRQRVTVMFSDINDFSTACEKLEPEEVTRRLNAYFGEMTNIIYRHQGTIIRFIGDEFMVLFGAPKSNEESEVSAVLAAVEMVDRLKELELADPDGVEGGFYEVKIGIHVGEMILTSIGNEIRSDYNCIGDSTNMAARVLSLTKPLGAMVLVSEETQNKAKASSKIRFEDMGVHPVKGRAGQVRVFEASSRKD